MMIKHMLSALFLLQLNVEPGVLGLKTMLHQSPSWLAFQDKEKVEVCVSAKTTLTGPIASWMIYYLMLFL